MQAVQLMQFFFNHSCNWLVVCHLWGWSGGATKQQNTFGKNKEEQLSVLAQQNRVGNLVARGGIFSREYQQSNSGYLMSCVSIENVLIDIGFMIIRFCCVKGLIFRFIVIFFFVFVIWLFLLLLPIQCFIWFISLIVFAWMYLLCVIGVPLQVPF